MKQKKLYYFLSSVLFFYILTTLFSNLSAKEVTYQFNTNGEIGFNGKSTLHPFQGIASHFKGTFSINWNNISASSGGSIEIDSASLNTKNKGRDKKIRHHLESATYPAIVFQAKSCQVSQETPAQNSILNLNLIGELTLRGISKRISIPIALTKTELSSINLKGEIPLTLSDFNISIPAFMGIIRVDKQVTVFFDLQANLVEDL